MEKTIHYIWLGGKKKPRVIRKCIATWKKHMPDWTIKEWNETNVDLDEYAFCREAYDAHRYAFAADVLRFSILYKEGGLYFDTDVKMLKSFEDLVKESQAFSGYEYKMAAPGLVLYAEPHNPIIGEMLEVYRNNHFLVDGQENQKVVGAYFSEVLEKHGFVYEDKKQVCDGFTIYTSDYFCPTDAFGNALNFTDNTHSVHLFAASWMPWRKRASNSVKRFCYKLLGKERIQRWMKKIKRR